MTLRAQQRVQHGEPLLRHPEIFKDLTNTLLSPPHPRGDASPMINEILIAHLRTRHSAHRNGHTLAPSSTWTLELPEPSKPR